MKKREGFSLIEIVITMALMGAIGTVAFVNLAAFRSNKVLLNQIEKMEAVMRDIQQRAVNEEQSSAWGIKITGAVSAKDYYETFYGSTYDSGTVSGTYYLPSELEFSDPAAGATKEIVFAQGTGTTTAATTTMRIIVDTNATETITVNSFGFVEVQD